MSVCKANRRKLLDLTWHQVSETSPKWETVWVALLSDPCAIHHATKLILYELAMNWRKNNICLNWNKILCVVRQVIQSAKCTLTRRLKDRSMCVRNKRMKVGGCNLKCCCTPRLWKRSWMGNKLFTMLIIQSCTIWWKSKLKQNSLYCKAGNVIGKMCTSHYYLVGIGNYSFVISNSVIST